MHSNGWIDIGYNFLIGGDEGMVFEAGGFDNMGAHTSGKKLTWFGFGLIA